MLGAAGRQGDPLVRHPRRRRLRQGDHHPRGPPGRVVEEPWHDGRDPGRAASAAAGLDRRAGAALRLLPERNDDPGGRPSRHDQEADRGADPHRDERPPVPLRHVPAHPHGDPEGRRSDGQGREVTMTEILKKDFSRKSFVKGGGAMVVGFSFLGAGIGAKAAKAADDPYASNGTYDQQQIDAWLTVNSDNTVTLRPQVVELGQGSLTGILMIAAEELDVDLGQMRFSVNNDTNVTPANFYTAGSSAIQSGGLAVR